MGCVNQKQKIIKLPTIVLESQRKSECTEKEDDINDGNEFKKSATSIVINKQVPKRASSNNQQLVQSLYRYKINKRMVKQQQIQKDDQLNSNIVRYRGISTESTYKHSLSPSQGSYKPACVTNLPPLFIKKQSAKAGVVMQKARQLLNKYGEQDVRITMEMLEAEF